MMTRIIVAACPFGKHRGQPFGSETWQAEVAARLGLESLFGPEADHEQPNNGSWSLCDAADPFVHCRIAPHDFDLTAQCTRM